MCYSTRKDVLRMVVLSTKKNDNKKNAPNQNAFPPVTEHFLRRSDIEHMLQNAFKKPLTTVIAGAGYGKTQAVLSALSEMECNVAWMQLSELDNHVARFWNRTAVTLKPWSQKLYDAMISLGYPESIAPFDQFLGMLANELPQTIPFIYVLDDFHHINNKSILNSISLFLSARAQNFSLVLISRKKPDISLSGLLSKGLLTRINEDDLRFSRDEMDEYFRVMGVELDEHVMSEVYTYTDGWIFAIYLVGLATKKGELQNSVFPAKIDIFELIENEIFAVASKELQDFLVRISAVDFIPARLLKEMAGNNQSLISEILLMSAFIRYDSYSDSFRIHQLFREFLSEKKDYLAESDIYEVHLAAAEWYSDNKYIFEAMHHYKEIGRYKEIFELIISIPGRVPYEAAEKLVKLLEQAPEDSIAAMPIIRIAKAGYLFNNNKLDEAKEELSRVVTEYEALPETEENQTVLGEAYLLLAVISMVLSDYAFEELFKMAHERLPEGSRLVDYRTGMAEGVNACSIKSPAAGELQRHQDALFRAAPYAAKAMNGCCYGLEYLNAAESSLYTADWKAAEKYAYEAIYRSRMYKQYDIEFIADFVLVRIYTAKGNYDKVTGILEQMEKQLETHQNADCISLFAIISGWFYMKIGKTDRVAKWIRDEEETRNIIAPVVIGRERLVRSDCLMAEERYTELLALVGQTDSVYEARGILFAVIQNKITKAILHHYMGNHAESIQSLNEAYELSHPNNLVMQFIEYGNKMRTLINSVRQNESCKIPRVWLDYIHTKASSYAKMLSLLMSKYDAAHAMDNGNQMSLSKRESEVMAYLYRGMTRKEIAANCFLSLSTVNSVLKSIFNKLGAVNAADAIRIAKEKGFI